MKKIILTKLVRRNFKGQNEVTLNFNEKETTIIGDNATGKTTTIDSFLWLFYGKDSNDKKDFEIKPLDKDNNVIHNLESSVEAFFDVIKDTGTTKKVFKRIYKEKWTKRRGGNEIDLTGHETSLFVNDVPQKQGEYKNEIDVLIDETTFKLITNVDYFHSLHWTDRRAMLIDWVGEIDKDAIVKGDKEFLELIKFLNEQELTVEKFKESLAFKRKKLKEEIQQIPIRIDEAEKSKPDVDDLDFDAQEERKTIVEEEIEGLTGSIEDKGRAYDTMLEKKKKISDGIYNTKIEIDQVRNDITSETSKASRDVDNELKIEKENLIEVNRQIKTIGSRIDNKKIDIDSSKSRSLRIGISLEDAEKELEEKTKEYNELDKQEVKLDDEQSNCSLCGEALKGDNLEKQKEAINQKKVKSLNKLVGEGEEIRVRYDKTEKEKGTTDSDLKGLNGDLVELNEQADIFIKQLFEVENKIKFIEEKSKNSEPIDVDALIDKKLLAHADYIKLNKELEKLEKQRDEFKVESNPNTDTFKEKRQGLKDELIGINTNLSKKTLISNLDKRIVQLQEDMQSKGQELADVEQQEFVVQKYERAEIDVIESSINSMFVNIKFKLFNQLLNKGFEPCCETLFEGVNFSTNLNLGGRINVGLEIIDFINKKTKTFAPVFIDNAESISVLHDMECQLIRLEKIKGLHKLADKDSYLKGLKQKIEASKTLVSLSEIVKNIPEPLFSYLQSAINDKTKSF